MARKPLSILLVTGMVCTLFAGQKDVEEKFYSLIFSEPQLEDVREKIVQSLVSQNPDYKAYRDVFDSWFNDVFAADSMKLHAKRFIDSTLTAEEMASILSFMESEVGQKFMSFNQGISKLFQGLTRQRLATYLPELRERIDQKRMGTLKEIETPRFSGSLVEDPAGKYNFRFSEEKWDLLNKNLSRHSDYTFEYKPAPCFGTIISGSSSMDSDMLKEVARNNLKRGARKIEVLEEKEIEHNGAKGYFMKMDALMNDSRLTYFGYYFGGNNGTVQVLCWTDREKAEKLEPEIQEFLDGMYAFVN